MKIKVFFKSAFWIGVITLLGSGLSFLNQIAIARYFGAQHQVDMYLFAISVPTFMAGIVATITSYSLVPKFAALSLRIKEHAIYIRTMMTAMIIISFIVCGLGYFLSPWQVIIMGSFNDTEAIVINQITWFTAALQILVSFLSALSTAHGEYFRPPIAGLFPYLGMLLLTVTLGAQFGIIMVAIGFFFGTFFSLVYLLWSNRRQFLDSYKYGSFKWRLMIDFILEGPFIALAMSCFTVYSIIDAHFAPLLGEANLSYLGYSQRVLIGIGNLVIAGPSAILVPHFARMVAEGSLNKFRNETIRTLGVILLFSLPIAIIASVYATPITRILFMRGAFNINAVLGVSEVFSVMVIGMVPMLCVVILFRIFYCLDTRIPQAIIGFSWSILYFLGSMVSSVKFGVIGIAYTYVGSWLICFFLTLILLHTTLRKMNYKMSIEH